MSIEVKLYFTLLIITAILVSIGFIIGCFNKKIGAIIAVPSFILFYIGIFSGLIILIWRC